MRAGIALGALLLASCSLVVGGAPPECTPGRGECAVLNDVDGIPADACQLWQCSQQSRSCVLGIRDLDGDGLVAAECAEGTGLPADCNDAVPSGGDETCNGLDDDCDGVIDEGAAPPDPGVLASAGPGTVTYSPAVGAIAFARTDAPNASFGVVDGDGVVGPAPMSVQRASDLVSLSDDALEPGCHRRRADGSVLNAMCNRADVGVGLGDSSVYVAAVSTDGCARGQLRLGYFDRADAAAPAVIERGPARRSNVFRGVDTDPALAMNGQCTGASRSDGRFGAARPAVAVGAAGHALTALLADTVERGACGGEEVGVEVIASLLERDTMGAGYGWVSASNEGVPQRVGATVGGGRPAVIAWGDDYLVGFGDADGAVRVVRVDAPPAPPAYDRGGAPDDRTGRETAPLSFADVGALDATGADDVALALGSIREGGVELGVAWREGCAGDARAVRFRRVFVTDDGALDAARSSAPVDLATGPLGPPAVAYAFDGFLAEGVARPDGRPTGERSNDGGWVVAWEDDEDADDGPGDDSRVLAARVSEADGLPLGEPVIAHAVTDARHGQPGLYRTGDDQIRALFVSIGGEAPAVRGGALTCQPAEM